MVDIRIYPSVEFPGQYILQLENDKGRDIKFLCPTKEQAFEAVDDIPQVLIDSLK